jgi:hypothetical protein
VDSNPVPLAIIAKARRLNSQRGITVRLVDRGQRSPKAHTLGRAHLQVNTHKRQPSTSGRDPVPDSPSVLRPVLLALSFTTILIEVQASAQGGVHDLLEVLIAALIVLAGLVPPGRPEA